MYLHLGQNTIVHDREIIGIFDLDITSQSHRTRDYLNRAERSGDVVNVSEELPKSFVVCAKPYNKEKQTVFISQLSSQTLLRRSEAGFQTDLR